VQNEKEQKLQKYLGRLPENVTFIAIDFDRQSLESVFAGTTFDLSSPAVFIWEAVTQYITEEAVRRTLAFVGKSAPGSVLLFTYVLKSIIERRSDIPGANKMMDFVANDSPWLFGLEPSTLVDYLMPFGLKLVADVRNAFYQEQYLQLVGRTLAVTEGERVAHAVVE
jgi:methyltransferase (TIGR00027 family)